MMKNKQSGAIGCVSCPAIQQEAKRVAKQKREEMTDESRRLWEEGEQKGGTIGTDKEHSISETENIEGMWRLDKDSVSLAILEETQKLNALEEGTLGFSNSCNEQWCVSGQNHPTSSSSSIHLNPNMNIQTAAIVQNQHDHFNPQINTNPVAEYSLSSFEDAAQQHYPPSAANNEMGEQTLCHDLSNQFSGSLLAASEHRKMQCSKCEGSPMGGDPQTATVNQQIQANMLSESVFDNQFMESISIVSECHSNQHQDHQGLHSSETVVEPADESTNQLSNTQICDSTPETISAALDQEYQESRECWYPQNVRLSETLNQKSQPNATREPGLDNLFIPPDSAVPGNQHQQHEELYSSEILDQTTDKSNIPIHGSILESDNSSEVSSMLRPHSFASSEMRQNRANLDSIANSSTHCPRNLASSERSLLYETDVGGESVSRAIRCKHFKSMPEMQANTSKQLNYHASNASQYANQIQEQPYHNNISQQVSADGNIAASETSTLTRSNLTLSEVYIPFHQPNVTMSTKQQMLARQSMLSSEMKHKAPCRGNDHDKIANSSGSKSINNSSEEENKQQISHDIESQHKQPVHQNNISQLSPVSQAPSNESVTQPSSVHHASSGESSARCPNHLALSQAIFPLYPNAASSVEKQARPSNISQQLPVAETEPHRSDISQPSHTSSDESSTRCPNHLVSSQPIFPLYLNVASSVEKQAHHGNISQQLSGAETERHRSDISQSSSVNYIASDETSTRCPNHLALCQTISPLYPHAASSVEKQAHHSNTSQQLSASQAYFDQLPTRPPRDLASSEMIHRVCQPNASTSVEKQSHHSENSQPSQMRLTSSYESLSHCSHDLASSEMVHICYQSTTATLVEKLPHGSNINQPPAVTQAPSDESSTCCPRNIPSNEMIWGYGDDCQGDVQNAGNESDTKRSLSHSHTGLTDNRRDQLQGASCYDSQKSPDENLTNEPEIEKLQTAGKSPIVATCNIHECSHRSQLACNGTKQLVCLHTGDICVGMNREIVAPEVNQILPVIPSRHNEPYVISEYHGRENLSKRISQLAESLQEVADQLPLTGDDQNPKQRLVKDKGSFKGSPKDMNQDHVTLKEKTGCLSQPCIIFPHCNPYFKENTEANRIFSNGKDLTMREDEAIRGSTSKANSHNIRVSNSNACCRHATHSQRFKLRFKCAENGSFCKHESQKLSPTNHCDTGFNVAATPISFLQNKHHRRDCSGQNETCSDPPGHRIKSYEAEDRDPPDNVLFGDSNGTLNSRLNTSPYRNSAKGGFTMSLGNTRLHKVTDICSRDPPPENSTKKQNLIEEKQKVQNERKETQRTQSKVHTEGEWQQCVVLKETACLQEEKQYLKETRGPGELEPQCCIEEGQRLLREEAEEARVNKEKSLRKEVFRNKRYWQQRINQEEGSQHQEKHQRHQNRGEQVPLRQSHDASVRKSEDRENECNQTTKNELLPMPPPQKETSLKNNVPIQRANSWDESSLGQLFRQIDEIEGDFETIVASLPSSSSGDENKCLKISCNEKCSPVEITLKNTGSFESNASMNSMMSNVEQRMHCIKDYIEHIEAENNDGMSDLILQLGNAAAELRALHEWND